MVKPTPNPNICYDGIPECSKEDCALYDDKRFCELLGDRPSWVCIPAIQGMAKDLERMQTILSGRRRRMKHNFRGMLRKLNRQNGKRKEAIRRLQDGAIPRSYRKGQHRMRERIIAELKHQDRNIAADIARRVDVVRSSDDESD